jgi:hypothetical protein
MKQQSSKVLEFKDALKNFAPSLTWCQQRQLSSNPQLWDEEASVLPIDI